MTKHPTTEMLLATLSPDDLEQIEMQEQEDLTHEAQMSQDVEVAKAVVGALAGSLLTEDEQAALFNKETAAKS